MPSVISREISETSDYFSECGSQRSSLGVQDLLPVITELSYRSHPLSLSHRRCSDPTPNDVAVDRSLPELLLPECDDSDVDDDINA